MKRKALSGIALAMASAMLLAGCGQGDSGNDGGSSSPVQQTELESQNEESKAGDEGSENVSGSSDEKVTISLFIADYEGIDYDNNPMTLLLEEKFNVELQFDVISSATDQNTALNLSIASEEYSDVYLSPWLSPAQVVSATQGGVFIPLNDYIVDGTSYRKALDENPGWEGMVTSPDGNIYTFFYNDSGVHKASEYKMWYRADWLENIGWDAPPTTPEEFKQFLMDIRDKDANGNGDTNDEIPLMGYYNGRQTDPICFLMNPYELYTNNYYYIDDNNEIHFSAITDEWREGLAYIADLYAEGLIDEATYSQDQATFKGILNKDGQDAQIGVFPCWYQGAEIDTAIMSWFTYEAMAPLKGENQQSAARFGGNFNLVGAISSQCEHPEKAFEILDYLISEEGSWMGMWGMEGTTYEIVDAENLYGGNRAVKQTVDRLIPEYLWNSGCFPRYDKEEMRYAAILDESTKESDNTFTLLKAAQTYEPYYVNHHIPDIVWCGDEQIVQAVTDYSAQINDYIKATDTEFIMGRKNIHDDAEWQAYLDQLDAMGLQDYIEILYTYYGLR